MRQLELDMIGIGPFIPHPDTPLGKHPIGNPMITLKVIEITRILLPHANIPTTTTLGMLSPAFRLRAFHCSANVVMPALTPERYKNLYEIYPVKTKIRVSIHTGRRLLKTSGEWFLIFTTLKW